MTNYLDKVYDKSVEYKNNLERYEANTDYIIDRIEKGKENNEDTKNISNNPFLNDGE